MPIPPSGLLSQKRAPSLVRTLVSYVMVYAIAFFPVFSLFPPSAMAGGNNIRPDGRTATHLSVNGATTDIRTNTMSGGRAFNSFTHFEVGNGKTVNLHVPGQANALVNVVRDAPVRVDGVLNGYKNGQIGGNVFFADPHGFIVGKSGVVNVGSLTVTTPTSDFLDEMIGPSGAVNNSHVNRLMSGAFPVSPDGDILIDGRINAINGVKLLGHNLSITGGRDAYTANQRQAANFSATVNGAGLSVGGGIVVENGEIEIVAAGSARLRGRIVAKRSGPKAAKVTVRAADDISVAGTSIIAATGSDARFDGGDILVLAGRDLVVDDGAFFAAAAQGGGDGGFVELSGVKTVELGQVHLDLAAVGGAAGTFLVDPEDLTIGSLVLANDGVNVVLEATRSITVTKDGTIDTRVLDMAGASTADSGNITITAPIIDIQTGAQLLAGVNNVDGTTFSAGDIALIALATDTQNSGDARGATAITVAGLLDGNDIMLSSIAVAASTYDVDDPGLSLQERLITKVASFAGINGAFVDAQASAVAQVVNGASITSTGQVTLMATSAQTAATPVIESTSTKALAVAVVQGSVTGGATSVIRDGASVSAAGGLNVVASNSATLDVAALTVATSNSKVEGSAALGDATITTSARIDGGANIVVGANQDVAILARNDNDFQVKATTEAVGNGRAGVAFAQSDTNTQAHAHLGADIGKAPHQAGNVVVEANSMTTRNTTDSITLAGGPGRDVQKRGSEQNDGEVDDAATAGAGNTRANETNGSTSTARAAGAIAISDSDAAAIADISADATKAAPTVNASGNVAVFTRVEQRGLRNTAVSAIVSEKKNPTAGNPSATVAVSTALSVSDFGNTSRAFVGEDVAIQGANVGVGAVTVVPVTQFPTVWVGTEQVLDNLKTVLVNNKGNERDLFTSYASATSQGTTAALAGSVNVFDLTHDTTAWVASGASIIQTGGTAGASTDWSQSGISYLRDGKDYVSDLGGQTWAAPVSITADSLIESVSLGGNFNWLAGAGTAGQPAGTGQPKAVGAALNLVTTTGQTLAGVSDDATITSDDAIDVQATTTDNVIALAPTSGTGAGIGGNGITSVATVDNTTQAAVSSGAALSAPGIVLMANQSLFLTNLAGAFTKQADGAVGLAVAVSDMDTNTAAFVGHTSGAILTRPDLAYLNPNAADASDGVITTDDLAVNSATLAGIDTLAVAGSVAAQASRPATGLAATATTQANAAAGRAQQASRGQPANYNLAISGSSAVNLSDLQTVAQLSGARVDEFSTGTGAAVSVVATNGGNVVAGSGSFALARAKRANATGVQAAIAGALALTLSNNSTRASMNGGANITQAGQTTVQAQDSGDLKTVGLGVALTSGADRGVAVAGSVSVAEISDTVSARITDATVTADAASTGPLSVTANQMTDLNMGGGTIGASTLAGFGASVTVADIDQSVIAAIDGASVIDVGMGTVSVDAAQSADIDGIAVGIAAATGTLAGQAAVSTSFIANEIMARVGGNGPTSIAARDVIVQARDNASVNTNAASAAFSRTASGGIAIVYTDIDNAITAGVIGATVDASGSVLVDAQSDSNATTTAVGIAVAGTGSLGGSVTTNANDTDVLAQVAGDADVVVDGTVTVASHSDDDITTIAGAIGASAGPLGLGVSVVVNEFNGTTKSHISGAGTRVDAVAATNVTAMSDQNITARAVSAGAAANVGVAVVPVTNIVGGDTAAKVLGASLNTRLVGVDPSALPSITVSANGITTMDSFALGISGGGSGAASGAAVGNRFSRAANATMSDVTVGDAGDVTVEATSSTTATGEAIGFAGAGGAGGTASGIVNVFRGLTQADVIGGTITATNLKIMAASSSRFDTMAGGVSGGGAAALGAAFAVNVSENQTRALLGEAGATTTLTLIGQLDVIADATTNDKTKTFAGAGAGKAGVSGNVAITTYDNITEAIVQNISLNQVAGSTGAAALKVDAKEDIVLDSFAGALAVGGVGGVGASANVVLFSSGVRSGLQDSLVNVSGAVDVAALTKKDLDALTMTGAGGGAAGVAASVSVVLVGDDLADSGQFGGGNETLASADTFAKSTDPSVTVAQRLGNAANDATTAEITGGQVVAGSVSVTANGEIRTDNSSYGFGVGGGGGAGAAIAYTGLENAVIASVSQGQITARTLNVKAGFKDRAANSDNRANKVSAAAGGGSLGAALGAAVAIANTNNVVAANASGDLNGSGVFVSGGKLTIEAEDTSTTESQALGVSAGTVGAGASVAHADKTSNVSATLENGQSAGGIEAVAITAANSGAVLADATAGAAGGLAGAAGADARGLDSTIVAAKIGAGARVSSGAGGLSVVATSAPNVVADSKGVAVAGGVAVGVSLSSARSNQNVLADVGDGAIILGGPLAVTAQTLTTNGPSTKADAAAVAGSLSLSANGAEANTLSQGVVHARVGNNVQLTHSDVTVRAISNSHQDSYATGVAAGVVAAGGVVTNATSDVLTTAELGQNVRQADIFDSGGNAVVRTGGLTVSASGTDKNEADSIAGTGAIVGGNAALARTRDSSTTTAIVGAGTNLYAGELAVTAEHIDQFKAKVNSVNASAVGASGANASHEATTNTRVQIGAGVSLVGLTDNPLTFIAENEFRQVGSGDSATAAAGGIANAAAAQSQIRLTGTAVVDFGNDVRLTAGQDPIQVRGGIDAVARTQVNVADTVSLSTGGLIQGASVDSTLNATLANTINLGDRNAWMTFGGINVGTYTIANVATDSAVSTYGLAAAGIARATTNVSNTDAVNIGDGVDILGLGTIWLTPGAHNFTSINTIFNAYANADGYVRGLIAIPDAHAAVAVNAASNLTVGNNTRVASARNVAIGGYHGFSETIATGVGNGFQAGFIPTKSKSSSSVKNLTSNVDLNAGSNIIAGVYNTQDIVIDCGGVACDHTTTPIVTLISGAPNAFSVADNFDVTSYVNNNFIALDANILLSAIDATQTNAVALGPLFASGGTVTINADTITGSGRVEANGGPSITVDNQSAAHLIVDDAFIPNAIGGEIFFTGLAGDVSGSGIQLSTSPDAAPTIQITNSYEDDAPLSVRRVGPAMFVQGELTNLGGGIAIRNETGSYGQTGSINAGTFNLNVPNGAAVISLTETGGLASVGAAPFAEWDGAINWPGGNPRGLGPNNFIQSSRDAAVFAINLIHGDGTFYGLLNELYSRSESAGSNPNDDLDPRSHLYFNTCAFPVFGNCLQGGSEKDFALSDFATNELGLFRGHFSQGYRWNGSAGGIWYTRVPLANVSTVRAGYDAANLNLAENSGINVGGQVVIRAGVININAPINVGRPTDRSVVIGQSAVNLIDFARWQASQGIGLGRKIDLAAYTTTVNGFDTLIRADYDVSSDQIILDDIIASSGGGHILLDGQIVSTNTLGRVTVNGGLGQVDIRNTSSATLFVDNISTGSPDASVAPSSSITVVDRHPQRSAATNKFVYTFAPSEGVRYFELGENESPGDRGAGAQLPGLSAAFAPVSGTRFQWNLQAALTRQVTSTNGAGLPTTLSDWAWERNFGSENPWRYNVSGNLTTDRSPRGFLTYNNSESSAFVQSYSASSSGQTYRINYGCVVVFSAPVCDWGFAPTQTNPDLAVWDYTVYDRINLFTSVSVKADNPITFSFRGNDVSDINIESTGSVLLGADIFNPGGDAVIRSTGGSIQQLAGMSILTQDLTLAAAGGIGSVDRAINATLTESAQLQAVGGRAGVYLDIASEANVSKVHAGNATTGFGDVSLKSSGAVQSQAGFNGTNVIGRNITISSQNGAIGTQARALRYDAHSTVSANGAETEGVVSIDALRDIILEDVGTGSARINQITSTTGNIALTANGKVVDANGQTAASNLTDAQLDAVSDRLGLTAAANASGKAVINSIAPFEALVNSNYQRYVAYLDNGSVDAAGTFTLANDKLDLFRGLAQQALEATLDPNNLPNPIPTASDADVRAFARARFEEITAPFERAYGSGWATLAHFQAEDPAFVFVASQDLRDTFFDAATDVWKRGQLLGAIDQAALQAGSVGNAEPLFVGRDVTLNVESIGSLAAPVRITLNDLVEGDLTREQQSALAVATGPNSVRGYGQDDLSGLEVTGLDILNVTPGTTLNGIEIAQIAPGFVSATGTFRATTASDVFVQATSLLQSAGGTLTIGQIVAGGGVSLAAPDAILGAPAGQTTPLETVQIIAGGDVSLLASGQNIGSAAVPLTYQTSGILQNAAAGGDVFLNAVNGDMRIGQVFAGGNASLTASNGAIVDTLDGVSIAATNIALNATDGLGATANPLTVQHGAGGRLSGVAGGAVNIYTPTLANQTTVDLDIDDLSGTSIRIGADGNVTANDLTSTSGDIEISSGLDADVNDVASAADIRVTTLRDVALGTSSAARDLTVLGSGDLAFGVGAVVAAGGAALLQSANISMLNGSALTADDEITISSAGVVSLTQIESRLDPGVPAEAISVTADQIVSADAANTNITASGTQSTASLTTISGVGGVGQPVSVQVASLGASTVSGGIALRGDGAAFNATTLTATAGDVSVVSQGNVAIDRVTATTDAVGIAAATGDVTVNTIVSGSDTVLDAADELNFDTIEAGGAVTAVARRASLSGVTVQAASDIQLTANISNTGDTATSSGGSVSLIAGGDITWNQVAASQDATLGSQAGQVTVDTVTTGRSQTLSTAIGLTFNTLQAGVDVSAFVQTGPAAGGDIFAGNDIEVDAFGIVVNVADAGRNLTLNSRKDLSVATARAGDTATLASGNRGVFNVGTIEAASLVLSASGTLAIERVDVEKEITLQADDIEVGVRHTGVGAPLLVSATGRNGSVANSADLVLDAPAGVVIASLRVVQADVVTSATDVRIIDGFVPGQFRLFTPVETIFMDNTRGGPISFAGVQLFEPDFAFDLSVSSRATVTNAFVVQFGTGSAVTVSNFSDDREAGAFFAGISLIRHFGTLAEQQTAPSQRLNGDTTSEALRFALASRASIDWDQPIVILTTLNDSPAVQALESKSGEVVLLD
ncbi:MAG: leukotoxin LktA family filamentous adhesin [Pseudomonadota bacterium]